MSNNLPTISVRSAHLTQTQTYAEVRDAYGEREISDSAAVTIASWWMAPSNPALTALATGCPTSAEAVCDDIARERRYSDVTGLDSLALDMLATWAINFEPVCLTKIDTMAQLPALPKIETYAVTACVCCALVAANGECCGESHDREPLALLLPGEVLTVDGEPYFTWRPCLTCGSSLGGDRYDATIIARVSA